jgi:hypothetical protein
MLARRINVASWLGRFAPAVFFVASAFAIAFFALRRAEQSLVAGWASLIAAWVIAAGWCAWRARRDFFRRAEARVLLESQLRLDARLTAAELGLVPWPAEPPNLPSVVEWRLRGPLAWLAASVALIAVAVFAPVPRDNTSVKPAGPPPALVQTDALLDALKQMNVAEPQALTQLDERARELARRATDEQYTHSGLEAADALHNQTIAAASGLARGLDSASNALRSANSGADMKSAAGRLAAALSGLRDGMLPANSALLANMPGSMADLSNLTVAQRAQLAEQLANAAKGVGGALGANAPVAAPGDAAGWGSGGPGGGGDTAPLMLAKDQSDAGDGNTEALKGDILKHFALGDKLGTTNSAHDVDPAKLAGPMSAGAVATPGAGGEAVWVNRLTPTERAALKNFFK